MKVGCFALVDPFQTLDHQLGRIAAMGFKYADVTDNSDGAALGVEFGFAAVASLDANPFDLRRAFEKHGLTVTSYCAHANLLDPPAPWRYGTPQILKAIRAASSMGVKHVITTEGDAKTERGHGLSDDEAIFSIRQNLYEPLRLAEDLGVQILLEPHGKYTDSVAHLTRILDACDSEALGVNLDTGNSWLGGADPVEMARVFKARIGHVHWKDLPREWEEKRGTMYGCGFSSIALGEGGIDIEGVWNELKDAPHIEYSTLEVGGDENVLKSYEYLKSLGAE